MSSARWKPSRLGVHEAPAEVLGPGEGDRVDQHVDAAERLGGSGHRGGDLGVVLDVQRHHRDAVVEGVGELAHVALGPLALVGQHQTGALGVHLAGDRPGDAALVGDAHDQAGHALQKLGQRSPPPTRSDGSGASARPDRAARYHAGARPPCAGGRGSPASGCAQAPHRRPRRGGPPRHGRNGPRARLSRQHLPDRRRQAVGLARRGHPDVQRAGRAAAQPGRRGGRTRTAPASARVPRESAPTAAWSRSPSAPACPTAPTPSATR